MTDTPVKVTVIAPCLSRGGMTRAYAVCDVLRHLGHDVDLVGHLPSSDTIYPAPPSHLQVTPVRGMFPFVIGSIARQVTGDVVFAIKPLPTSLGAALNVKRRRGVRVVVDIDDHELQFLSHRGRRRHDAGPLRSAARGAIRFVRRLPRRVSNQHGRWWLRWMERRLEDADAVTTNSLSLQGHFGGALLRGARDTTVFDPSRFDDDTCRNALGLGENFVVMFPGTARRHKGLEDVLDALDRWNNDAARMVIVGGRGIGLEYARELALKWPQWVQSIPGRGIEEMPATLAAAHVVVVAQRDIAIARSQFPIKLTDAMAMARPIITTTVGDIPDVVGDSAWVVPPSSPSAIVTALQEIAADPARARSRGAAARQRCIETLSLDAAAGVMKEVLAFRRAGRAASPRR